jgi:hypothetical protein
MFAVAAREKRPPTEAASIQESAQLLHDLAQIVGVFLADPQSLL